MTSQYSKITNDLTKLSLFFSISHSLPLSVFRSFDRWSEFQKSKLIERHEIRHLGMIQWLYKLTLPNRIGTLVLESILYLFRHVKRNTINNGGLIDLGFSFVFFDTDRWMRYSYYTYLQLYIQQIGLYHTRRYKFRQQDQTHRITR